MQIRSIRVKGDNQNEFGKVDIAWVPLYEYLGALWEVAGEAAFMYAMFGNHIDLDDEASPPQDQALKLCEAFWASLGRAPPDLHPPHPLVSDPAMRDLRKWHIPILQHADGGEIYNDSCFSIGHAYSAYASDCHGDDTRFLNWMIPEELVIEETFDDLLELMAGDYEILWTGKRPDGSLIAGGWCASFAAFTGDLKETAKEHRLARNYAASFLCCKCLACKTIVRANPWDFSDGTWWRANPTTHEQYLRATHPVDRSPWLRLRGWHLRRNREDILHQGYLGWTCCPLAYLVLAAGVTCTVKG
jgi:hypothetical protein